MQLSGPSPASIRAIPRSLFLTMLFVGLAVCSASAQYNAGGISTDKGSLGVDVVTGKMYSANPFCEFSVANLSTGPGFPIANPLYGDAYCNGGNAYASIAINPITNRIYIGSALTNLGLNVIDGATDTVLPPIPLNAEFTEVSAIAVDIATNRIYATEQYSNVLDVIDGNTNSLIAVISIPGNPSAVAVNPITNRIYVATFGGGTITVIDGATNSVIYGVGTGQILSDIAINVVTNQIYVIGHLSLFILDGATNSLSSVGPGYVLQDGSEEDWDAVVVNPVTNMVYARNTQNLGVGMFSYNATTGAVGTYVDSYNFSSGITVNPMTNQIYVIDSQNYGAFILDGNTGNTSRLGLTTNPNDLYPTAVAVNPISNKTYVGYSHVEVIDNARYGTAAVAAGTSPTAVAVNPVSNKTYVANNGGSSVTIIDSSNNPTTVSTGSSPTAIAINPVTDVAYVANDNSSGTVTAIDANNNASTINVGSHPKALDVDTVTNKLYVANSTGNNLSVVDAANGNAVTTITTGNDPVAVAVNSAANKIYVANYADSTVTLLDGVTNIATTLSTGTSPIAVAVNTVTNNIYIANSGSANVTVLDGATETVSSTIAVGNNPIAIAIDKATNRIFVANAGDSTVTEIDGNNGNIVNTFGLLSSTLTGLLVDSLSNKVYAIASGSSSSTSYLAALDESTNYQSATILVPSPTGIGFNSMTGNLYLSSSANSNVTVVTPNAIQTVPLTTVITPVTDSKTLSAANAPVFVTASDIPSFTVTVTSAYTSSVAYSGVTGAANPTPTAIYYRVDTGSIWTRVTPNAVVNPATFAVTLPATAYGLHTLYLYAAYDNETGYGSSQNGTGNIPEIGNITQLKFQIDPTTATVSVTRNISPQQALLPITFTATVSPSNATGTVTFVDTLGSVSTLLGTGTVSGGVATLSAGLSGTGTHTVYALYSGDAVYGSSGGTVSETIFTPDTTATTITSLGPNPLLVGGSTTITASVADVSVPATQLTGSITFTATIGGVTITLGTVTMSAQTASLLYTPPTAGSFTIAATYNTSNAAAYYTSAGNATLTVASLSVVVPSTAVGSASPTQTIVLTFPSTVTLNSTTPIKVLSQGVLNFDFKLVPGGTCATGTTYSAGTGCTVLVNFTPQYAGQRLGSVQAFNNAATPALVSFANIHGIGSAPLSLFSNGIANALLSSRSTPSSVTTDSSGNVYFTEQGTSSLSVVNSSGTITALAGSINMPTGVAIDGAGNIFYGSYEDGKVYELLAGAGSSQFVASVSNPDIGVAIDAAGNIYVTGSLGVTQINALTHATMMLTSSVAGLGSVSGVAIDSSGNLFFSDFTHNNIYELAANSAGTPDTTQTPTLVISTGLSGPRGLAFDPAGNLYIANQTSGNITRVATANAYAQTVIATGYSFNSLAIDPTGTLYSTPANSVLQFSRAVTTPIIFANFGDGRRSAAQTVTLENDGNLQLPFVSFAATANFSADPASTNCSAGPLPVLSTCVAGVAFTPAAGITGASTGTFSITDNSNNASAAVHSVALSGTSYTTTPQTITFTQPTSPVLNGSAPITLVASSSVGLPVTFSAIGPAILSGNTLSFIGVGTVVVSANQGGDATHAAAPTVSYAIIVNAGPVAYTNPALTVGATSSVQTATLTFTAPATLSTIQVLTGGIANLDFQFTSGGNCAIGTAYISGQACTVNYTFTPAVPALRHGAIVLLDSSVTPVRVATSYLSGAGNSPLGLFSTGANSTFASIGYPNDAAFDGSGNMVVTSYTGNVLQRITPGGIATTLLQGLSQPSGVAVDGAGNIFYGATGGLYELPAGTTSGVLIASSLTVDNSIAIDATGSLYIYAGTTAGIVKLAAGTFAQSTVLAGSATGRVIGMTIDPAGTLYLADFDNNKIFSLSSGSSALTLLSSGGSLNGPDGIAIDAAGNLYVSNYGGGSVLKLAAGTYTQSTLLTGFTALFALADPLGNLYFGDSTSNRIVNLQRQLSPTVLLPNTALGASMQQTVALENDGNQPLALTALTPPSSSVFTLNSGGTTCTATTSLAVAASCAIKVSFAPTVIGSVTGSLGITANSLAVPGTAQTLTLNSTGIDYPSAIAFDPTFVTSATSGRTPSTVTINLTDLLGNLAQQSVANVTLTVTGSTGYSASYSVVPTGGVAAFIGLPPLEVPDTYTYQATYLTLNATATQTVAVASMTSPLSAPSTTVGVTSVIQTATVTFAVTTTLNTIQVLTQGITNLDFELISGGTCTPGASYTAAQSCTVFYTFTPTAPGLRRGAIVLTDTSGSAIPVATLYLSGTGNSALGLFPSASATLASVGYPADAALDGSGNLIVSDGSSGSLKKITPAGVVSTLLSGLSPSGVGIDGAGNIFYGSGSNVYELLGGAGSPILVTTLSSTDNSIAVDGAGNLYLYTGSGIVKLAAGTFAQTTIVPASAMGRIIGITVDAAGTLYLADFSNNKIYSVVVGSSTLTLLASGGSLNLPDGIAIDPAGNLYVANYGTGIVKLAAGTYMQTVLDSSFGALFIKVDLLGNLYAGDRSNGRVVLFTRVTAPSFSFSGVSVGSSTAPQTAAFENDGNQPLVISNLSASTNFGISSAASTCVTGSLSAAATCNLGFVFAPQSSGIFSGAAMITDNSLATSGTVQSIPLTGGGASVAANLLFGSAPASLLYSNALPLTVTVDIDNIFNNLVASATNGVTLTVSGPGGYTASYTTTAVGGIASFSGLAALAIPGFYTYQATSSGLTSVSATQTVVVVVGVAATAPTTLVGAQSATQTATITFAAPAALGSINLLTLGAPSLDFKLLSGGTCAVGAIYSAAQTCTVLYAFAPTAPGMRRGAIVLRDDSGLSASTTYVSGLGNGALALFPAVSGTTFASLNYPDNAAFDGSGNLYAMTGSGTVLQKITSAGVVSAVVSGITGGSGVGIDGAGNIFYGAAGTVYELVGGSGLPVLIAQVNSTDNDIVVDGAGNLYIYTGGVSGVVRIAAGTFAQTTIVPGNSTGRIIGMTMDATGNLYLADFSNNKIFELAVNTTTLTTIAAGGLLNNPDGIAIDPAGNLYVANYSDGILRLASGTYTQSTFESGYSALFVKTDPMGNLYTGDATNSRIIEYINSVVPSLTFVTTDIGASSTPQIVTIENDGNQPLNIISLVSTSSVFSISSSQTTCNSVTPLAIASSCALVISFSPPTTGTFTAAVNVTDNALSTGGAVQSIAVNGGSDDVASKLVFVTAPLPTLYLSAAEPMLMVNVEDPLNNIMTTYAGTVTLTVNGPAYSTTYTAAVVNGVATFNELAQLPALGTFTYVASSGTLSSATTTQLIVTTSVTSVTAPTTNVGLTSATQSVTISFVAPVTLGTISVTTKGVANLDFNVVAGGTCTVGTTYTAAQTCTVLYNFAPHAPGLRLGSVLVYDNAATPNLRAIAYIGGLGNAALALFPPTTPTTLASVSNPSGAAFDGSGNLLVANPGGRNPGGLLRITPAGVVTTLVSNVTSLKGVAVDGAGNLFYSAGTTIYELLGGTGTSVVVAQIATPDNTLIVDAAGNLYLYAGANNGVIKLAAGTFVQSSVLAGNATGRIIGMTLDAGGDLFAADFSNSQIVEVAAGASTSSVISSGGLLSNPEGIAIDPAGDLYVANFTGAASVLKIAASGYAQSSLLTGIRAVFTELDPGGNLYIGDGTHGQVLVYNNAAVPNLTFATTDIGLTTVQQIVTVENDGNLPLQLTGLALTNSAFNLSGAATTCTSSTQLALAASCGLGVIFAPATTNSFSGFVNLTDNALSAGGAVQAIAISGNGVDVETRLVFANSPPTQVFPGRALPNLVVDLEDGLNNISPGATDTVTLTVTGPNYSATYNATAVAGVATFTNLAPLLGPGAYTYQATSGLLTPASVSQTVIATAVGTSSAPATTVGSTSATQTATLTFSASTTLGSISIVTLGRVDLDFKFVNGGTCTVGTAYTAAQTCTVDYVFAPTTPGLRRGAILISDAVDTVPIAITYLGGVGNGALGVFPGVASTALASLPYPDDAAIDSSGNVDVMTTNGTLLQQITAAGGVVSTLVSGITGGSGVGIDGAGNTFYGAAGAVYELVGGSGSPILVAQVNSTDNSLIVDAAGNLYIYTGNSTGVVQLAAGTFAQTTIVPGGSTGRVIGMTIDGAGNLYVADFDNSNLYKVAANTFTLIPIATADTFSNPDGIAIDPAGNLFVSNYNGGVVKVSAGTYAETTLDSGYSATFTKIDGAGNLYIGDVTNNRVVEIVRAAGALNFPVTLAGASSPEQTAVLENDGNLPLSISASAVTANFAFGPSNTCTSSASVAPLATCSVGVIFSPAQPVYAATGSVNVSDNTFGTSTQQVALTGSAPSQFITFPPPASPILVGGLPITLFATASSGLPVSFSATGPATVSGNILTITGSGTVVVTASQSGGSGSTAATPVSNTIIVTPGLPSYVAPSTDVTATSVVQTAVLTFAATTTLNTNLVTAIQIVTQGVPNLDFNYVAGGGCIPGATYAAGQSCTVNYTFTPTAPGIRSGAIVLYNSSTAPAATVWLSGSGIGGLGLFALTTGMQFASVTNPRQAVLDAAGNLYVIAGSSDTTLLKLSPAGVPTTLVTDNTGITAIAIDGAGNIFYAEFGGNIYELLNGTGYPVAVNTAIHANYMIADASGNLLVSTSNVITHLAAGNYTDSYLSLTQFNFIDSLALAPNGDVYVGERLQLQKFDPYYGTTTIVSGSPFLVPLGMTIDPAGNIYASINTGSIIRVDGNTSALTTFATGFNSSFVQADAHGNLYVGDTTNNRIVVYNRNNASLSFADTPVGSTSADQIVTLENDGTGPLTLSTFNATNASFNTADNTCATVSPLASDATCNAAVQFSPTAGGLQVATAVITDNTGAAAGSLQTITLNGTGIPGTATQTINFPQPSVLTAGGSEALTASASSGLAVTYTVTSGPGAITGSALTGTTAGYVVITATQGGNITYAAAPPVQQTVVVVGTPVITWTPSTAKFYYGSVLGASILDAASTTPGTFTYTATLAGGSAVAVTASTVLAAGTYTLTATLTPADTTIYTTATATVSLTVTPEYIWVLNSDISISQLDATGLPTSASAIIGGSSLTTTGGGIAFDSSGNLWSVNSTSNQILRATESGANVIPFTGGGLNVPVAVAVDGNGALWIANSSGSVSTFSNAGAPISPATTGYIGGSLNAPTGIAVDISGNVWLTNGGNNTVTEILGGAAPVDPLADGTQNSTLGTKP